MGLHKTLVNHGLKVKAQEAMDRCAETQSNCIRQNRSESDQPVVEKREIKEYQSDMTAQKTAEENEGKLGEAVKDSSCHELCSFKEIVKKEENGDEIIT